MELLAEKAFALYSDVLKLNGQSPFTTDSLQISIMISGLAYNINRFDEFKTCVSLMNSDIKISSLLGKLVGTFAGMSTIENAEICISQFIQQVYLKSKNTSVDHSVFNEQYEMYEELFFSNTMRFVDTVRLHNFESEVEEIALEEGLAIKRLPKDHDVQTTMQERRYRPYTQFSKSEFVIERRYTKQKLVGGFTSEPDPEQVTKELNESGDLFDIAIKSLRILKSSAAYRDHVITTETITYSPYAGVTSRVPFFENIVLGDKCVLSAEEADELKAIILKAKQAGFQPFKIASNRLSFGMERRFDEDKLLDYMIGLESLFLPDGNDELTFRLSLRVAFLINQDMVERKKIFKFIRKMYELRSKIAHGNAHGKKFKLTKEDISKIEGILRSTLKIYLENPSAFTSDSLNNVYF